MAATKRLNDVLRDFPDFKPGWTLLGPDGQPRAGDWTAQSRFGSAGHAVVMHADGTPNFDRPYYEEAPAVNVIAFGIRWTRRRFRWKRNVLIAILQQPRPHADDPRKQGTDGHASVVFGQIPMGFADKVLGDKFESPEEAATREVAEETGATAVRRIIRPPCPWHCPNPTFVKSWTDILFVEVDLAKIGEMKTRRDEPIYSAEYVSQEELERRILKGEHEGAYYRASTSLSALKIFDAWFRAHYA